MSEEKMYKCVNGVDILMTTEEVKEYFSSLPDPVELKKLQIREQRNNLLADTDWMALSDNTMSPEWASYRQTLRDITSHANWPNLSESDWPSKPTE